MLYSSTILARNASTILSRLSRLPAELGAHPLLFTLSANAPPASLSPLVSALSSLSSSGSVGCLSAAAHPGAPIACSLAFFHKEDATPFYSDIPGRPETQVGRWHAMRKKGEDKSLLGSEPLLEEGENVDWERIWSRGSLAGDDALPSSLRGLRQADVHTIITLTDNAPQGLNQALSSSFAHATKLGLFASSTPFVTGRPYTLIFNDSVKSSGAVGLALSAGPRPVLQTAFPGLRAITAPLTVTQSEGNLVNELDNANPTALLISAIEKSAIAGDAAKDDEFYLGVLRDGELWQLHHIMAGGPSRGTMALETETAPREGTSVQLFHRPSNHDIAPADAILPGCAKNTLAFVASLQPGDDVAALVEGEEEGGEDGVVTVLEDTFVAASANGFMLRREGEVTWTCISPGAQVRLTW
ncbi:hypothetical protein EDB84DRAFT_1558165 [Lactarius hengduanensis]|nr:hypothetical protein EDB84DRAFT_1558165 [Lactarius hengduanensis]